MQNLITLASIPWEPLHVVQLVEQRFLGLLVNLPGFKHGLSAFQDKISDGKWFAHRRRSVPNKEAGLGSMSI